MACTGCGSDEWKLASLVHSEGLSHVNTTTTGVGVGSNRVFGGGTARTSGTQQSAMSKRAAPPSGYLKTKILSIVCVISIIVSFSGGAWWWFILAAGSAYGLYVVYPVEKKTHTEQMEQWKNKRVCQRCGTFWLP